MNFGLTDKVALVTAASRGIGYAVAADLLAEGAKVVISARNEKRLQTAADRLRAATGGDVVAIQADLALLEDINRLVRATEDRFGRIDILVNNSAGPPTKRFVELTDDDWRGALEVKFLPQVRCARAVFPGMLARCWGRIITLIGTHGRQPHAYAITAGVVNAALFNLTKALAEEGAPSNVLVNAVNPGPIETERMRYLVSEKAREEGISEQEANAILTDEVMLRRFGQPEDIAVAVVFLASERAGFITGTTIDVDGGQTKTI